MYLCDMKNWMFWICVLLFLAGCKWWFSATDIIRAINDEDDYKKAGNYWRWLKKKLTAEGIQLVSITHRPHR